MPAAHPQRQARQRDGAHGPRHEGHRSGAVSHRRHRAEQGHLGPGLVAAHGHDADPGLGATEFRGVQGDAEGTRGVGPGDHGLVGADAHLALEAIGGYTVLLSDSGADGLRRASAEQPDLILLDVMMPGIDGPTVLVTLRADPDTASIPVIFMTAKVQPAEVEHFTSLGALGVIAKPFDPMTLADAVRRLWDGRPAA